MTEAERLSLVSNCTKYNQYLKSILLGLVPLGEKVYTIPDLCYTASLLQTAYELTEVTPKREENEAFLQVFSKEFLSFCSEDDVVGAAFSARDDFEEKYKEYLRLSRLQSEIK